MAFAAAVDVTAAVVVVVAAAAAAAVVVEVALLSSARLLLLVSKLLLFSADTPLVCFGCVTPGSSVIAFPDDDFCELPDVLLSRGVTVEVEVDIREVTAGAREPLAFCLSPLEGAR